MIAQDYRLTENLYVLPTPAGAYYAVSSFEQHQSRKLLIELLRQETSPLLTPNALQEWTRMQTEEAMELLFRVQNLGWIEGFETPRSVQRSSLEEMIPNLLTSLSGNGKALLADNQGFYIASHGFPHETAEELSALSAELATVHLRRQGLLEKNLSLQTSAWAVVDAAGNSQVGFWPLYIGKERFVLVVSGLPHLNQPALTELIWALSKRYASVS